MPNNPLITFILFAYNQEGFVREAVQGAFAQTYSPLEIILSDDCSTDRTFSVMKEMAVAYRGPHRIVLNQNKKNVGLVPHLNKLFMEFAHGELVVLAAGDDVSCSARTESLVEAWLKNGKPSGVGSRCCEIDGNSAKIPKEHAYDWESHLDKCRLLDGTDNVKRTLMFLGNGGCSYVRGCAAAWSADLFRLFGPLPENAFGEDALLAMRALLFKGEAWVDKELLAYRRHLTNSSTFYQTGQNGSYQTTVLQEKRSLERWRKHGSLAKLFRQDVRTAAALELVSLEEAATIDAVLAGMCQIETIMLSWFDLGFFERVSSIPTLIRKKGLVVALAWAGSRLLPLKASCWFRWAIRSVLRKPGKSDK